MSRLKEDLELDRQKLAEHIAAAIQREQQGKDLETKDCVLVAFCLVLL